jgi:hypothetical protein
VASPVATGDEGIVLKLEEMKVEELYHCIFERKVFLFYKDSQQFLHCYEIEDSELVSEIREHPENLKEIIRKHSTSEKTQ